MGTLLIVDEYSDIRSGFKGELDIHVFIDLNI